MPTEDPPVVCRVAPDGEVICEPVHPGGDSISDPATRQHVEASIRAAFPGSEWGPNKIKLALNILDALNKASLPDSPNIPRRAGEIVDSIKLLLAKEPPSMILYNYSTQPADIVGAYYQAKAELVRMQRLYDTFKKPVPY